MAPLVMVIEDEEALGLLLKYNLEKKATKSFWRPGATKRWPKLKIRPVGYSAGLDAARNFRRGNLQAGPQQA